MTASRSAPHACPCALYDRAASRRSSPRYRAGNGWSGRAARSASRWARSPRPAKRRALAPKSRSGASISRVESDRHRAGVREPAQHADPVTAILDEAQGKQLFVARSSMSPADDEAFCAARAAIDGLDDDAAAASRSPSRTNGSSRGANGEPMAMSPDLILRRRHGVGQCGGHRDDPLWHAGTVVPCGAAGFPDPEGS